MRTREVSTVDRFTMADVYKALRAMFPDLGTGAGVDVSVGVEFVPAPEGGEGAVVGPSGQWGAPVVRVTSTVKAEPPGGGR